MHWEQSCTSELFKVIQDAVSLILLYRTVSLFRTVSSSFFIMSDGNQSTFHHQFGLIPGGQILSNRLPVDPVDKEHKDPDTIDLEAPRLAQYMHKAWKKHQNTVYTRRRTTTTSRKPLRCSSKILRWRRKYLLLQADQRPKQNHKDVLLPAHPQKLYLLEKEIGPISNHKIIRPPIIQCRSNWSLLFVVVVYLETKMERLNSGN